MIESVNFCKQFDRSTKRGKKMIKEEFLAVDNVSLQAREGEIVGILGPNGAGKTTLLRMLGMLMTPTSGIIKMTDMSGNKIEDLTKKKGAIGYLSGNTKLYQRFSIREYLQFLGELYEYPKQEIGERIKEIFQVLDMETFADNHIGKLSTGQTQRASIARCLMADPQLYILDEPTLGLDILSADAIIYFMQQQKEKGKTVLYSTHYLEEAEVLCDRIYMICDGRIAASGTPQELRIKTASENLRAAFHAIYNRVKGDSHQMEIAH